MSLHEALTRRRTRMDNAVNEIEGQPCSLRPAEEVEEALGEFDSLTEQPKERLISLEAEESREDVLLKKANQLASKVVSKIEQEVPLYPETKESDSFPRFQNFFSRALEFVFDPATPERLEEFCKLLGEIESSWEMLKADCLRGTHDAALLTVGSRAEVDALGVECREEIRERGYALVRSSLLGVDFAVVGGIASPRSLPEGCSTITLTDLIRLNEEYRAGAVKTVGDLRKWFLSRSSRPDRQQGSASSPEIGKKAGEETATKREIYAQETLFPDQKELNSGQSHRLPLTVGVEFDPPPRTWQDWLDAVRVKIVGDLESWKRAVAKAKEAGVCGLDTETTGLDPHLHRLRLVQLAIPVFPDDVSKDQRYLVKADRKSKTPGENDWKYPTEGASAVSYVLDLFALDEREGRDAAKEAVRLLEDLVAGEEAVKIFHNAAFDLSFLRAAVGHRIKVSRIFDTMIASQLVTAGDFIPESQFPRWCEKNKITVTKSKTGKTLYLDPHGHELKFEHDTQKNIRPVYPTHSLQQVAHRHLEVWLEKDDLQDSDWNAPSLSEEQIIYAGKDAAVLLPLREILLQLLAKNRLLEVAQIEFNCIPAVVEIELSGMPFDAERARKIKDDASARFEERRKRLVEIARENGFRAVPKKSQKKKTGLPCDLNPDSPVDVIECLRILGDREGILDGDRFVVGGEEFPIESMDDTLARLSSRLPGGSPMKEFIENLREYRSAKKTYDFTKKWLELLHPKTGRLHPSLRQINPQGVGRFSASSPNLQQVERDPKVRALFHVSENRKLIIADYSGIEMRIMAELSQDKTLIKAFREGIDIHKFTASQISEKPIEEITKEERQASKACFSADTEILTARGWVRFDEYDGETPVAQFSLEGFEYNPPRSPGNRWTRSRKRRCLGIGKIDFVRPLAFRSFEDRELVHYADRNVDLLVTPDHEVIWIDSSGRPRKLRADEINSGNVRYFIAAGFYEKENFALNEAETRVLAMAVADGSFKRQKGCLSFGFSKSRKIERCRSLLKACGVEFKEAVYSNGNHGRATHFIISDREFVSKLLRYVSEDKDLRVEAILDLNPLWYLDEAKHWDSCIVHKGKRGERVVFSTTRRQTADVMQMMAALAGVPSVLRVDEDPRYMDYKIYTLSYLLPFSPHPLWRQGAKKKGKLFEAVPGEHRVYCVQVPSGAIVVRRNGKVVVCGNCNFGLIYGLGGHGLRQYAETSYGVKMTLEEAEATREMFFRVYSGIAKWQELQDRKNFESNFQLYWRHEYDRGIYVEKRPCARTLGNRLRVWPTVEQKRRNGDGTYLRKAGSRNELFNSPDQGTGADMIKSAMVALYQELLARGWDDVFLIGCVHDELILDAPEKKAKDAASLLQETMVRAGEKLLPNVPVEVEVTVCESWAEKA